MAAAAVFLELRQIWEPLDPETSSKVKYAKYHALRIAKAIKAGEDPNMTNPAPRPDPIEASSLNSHDIDPSPLEGRSPPAAAYQPTVEEVSDEHNSPRTYEAQDSAAAQPQYPSRAPPVSPRPDQVAFAPPETAPTINETENYYYSPPAPDVSPLQSPDRGRNGSIGGGYFPRTPDAGGQASMTNGHPDGLDLSASPGLPDTSFIPHPNALSPSAPPAPSAQSFRSFPPPGIGQDTMSTSANPAVPLDSQRASIASAQPSRFPQPPPPFGMPQPSITPMHQATPTSFPASGQQSHTSNVVIDEEALAKAQKHARWAISALNFEDVNTAIKELRGALESLGAR